MIAARYAAVAGIIVPTKTNDTGGIGGTGAETVQIAAILKAAEIIIEDYVSKYFEIK